MDKSTIVSVRLAVADLRKVQLLAQVYDTSVGELIRAAVAKHVNELIETEAFRFKALALKQRNDETLKELLKGADATNRASSVVRNFPHPELAPDAVRTKRGNPKTAASVGQAPVLVAVRVEPAERAEFGAAAKHSGRNVVRAVKPRLSFSLTWKQGGREWTMEGHVQGPNNEVILLGQDVTGTPGFVTWRSSTTGDQERFNVRALPDGRMLVDVSLAKARKRAELVQNAASPIETKDMLPIVRDS